MRNRILAMIAALPLVAMAQNAQTAPQGAGTAPGAGPGAGPRFDPARIEKRMRLVRTLGLAEALDLDSAQALKLGDTIAKFDDRRLAAHKQLRDAHDVLRRAAQGEKVTSADVDNAIQKALDARTQLQTIDRDVVATVTKDLTPEKKARAVLFLSRFEHRFGPGMAHHMGAGMMRGMGPGMGKGMGHGMGPGMGPGNRGGGMGPGGGWGMGPGGGQGMGPDGGPGMMGMGQSDDWEDDG